MPSKKSSKSKDKDDNKMAPLPSFRGVLKRMDEKAISMELEDHRVLQFKRNGKTKFYRDGDELKSPKFDLGDQLSVEGSADVQGFLTAVNVYWEKAGHVPTGDATHTSIDVPPDAQKTANKDDAKEGAEAQRATELAPPAAKADPDDPGRPRLQRSRPADPQRERAATVPDQPATAAAAVPATATTAGNASSTPSDDGSPYAYFFKDPLIRKAANMAGDFTETLPDYFCQEIMARFQSLTKPASWQALDVVTATVVYDKGKEDYRDIAINGKAVKKQMEEMEGAWSTGEFGSVLIDLFSPNTAANFQAKGDSPSGGIKAKLYDFSVKRENSHWTIGTGGQQFNPQYKGSVWIDPATSRVLRIEKQASGFPEEFPTDLVESTVDYQFIRLGDLKQYLLPVHVENLTCQRTANFCTKNVIDFRNYHKYTGDSSITFGDIKK
jgi:hypothetical protein